MHRIIKTIATCHRLRKIPLKVFFHIKTPLSALNYDCMLSSPSKHIRLKVDLSSHEVERCEETEKQR